MTTLTALGALTHAAPLGTMIPSPPQGVWEIGPIPIRAYALCIIAGIIVAAIWGNRRLVARGGRPGAVMDLAIWMIPFGIVGGRLYHVMTDPELYFGNSSFISDGYWNPWGVFEIWNGGLGIWGAVALGGLGAYIGARRYKIPFGALADALAPCIVLAQGIGRLGNYFNQELFGKPTEVWWALEVYLRTPGGVPGTAAECGNADFPPDWIKSSSDILCGTFHPTFLYELIWDVLIALVVVVADRFFRLGHGRAFAVYVAGYTFGRGWIEMLRIDTANHILGLRINVFTAAIMFVAAVVYLIVTRGRGREDPAEVYGIEVDLSRSAGQDARAGTDNTDTDGDAADPDGDDTDPDGDDTGGAGTDPDVADTDAAGTGEGAGTDAADRGDGAARTAADDDPAGVAPDDEHVIGADADDERAAGDPDRS